MEICRKRKNNEFEHSYRENKRINDSRTKFTLINVDKEIINLKKIISKLVEQINFQNHKINLLEEKIDNEKDTHNEKNIENIYSMINMLQNHNINEKKPQMEYDYIS